MNAKLRWDGDWLVFENGTGLALTYALNPAPHAGRLGVEYSANCLGRSYRTIEATRRAVERHFGVELT